MRPTFLGLALLAVACASSPSRQGRPVAAQPAESPASPAPAAAPKFVTANAWSGATREILVQHCGSCHRKDLPTAVPRALAVFDLTRETWFDTIRVDQLDAMMMRIRGTRAIEERDRADVERFVRCARDGACG